MHMDFIGPLRGRGGHRKKRERAKGKEEMNLNPEKNEKSASVYSAFL